MELLMIDNRKKLCYNGFNKTKDEQYPAAHWGVSPVGGVKTIITVTVFIFRVCKEGSQRWFFFVAFADTGS